MHTYRKTFEELLEGGSILKDKLECSPSGEPCKISLYSKKTQVPTTGGDAPALEDSNFALKLETSTGESLSVPNVVGMTAREALRVLSGQNLQVRLKGSGMVIKQSLEPCTPSDEKQSCVIECSPR